jgi:hypothetical protein
MRQEENTSPTCPIRHQKRYPQAILALLVTKSGKPARFPVALSDTKIFRKSITHRGLPYQIPGLALSDTEACPNAPHKLALTDTKITTIH